MFRETDVSLLLIPAFAVAAIFIFFAKAKLSRESDPRKTLAMRLRFTLWAAGGFFLYLWFLLPSTPSLSTFGYPQTAADVGDPQKVLHYLQWYNREIVRTAEVVHWAIFVGVFLVGTSIETALREFGTNSSGASDPAGKEDEERG